MAMKLPADARKNKAAEETVMASFNQYATVNQGEHRCESVMDADGAAWGYSDNDGLCKMKSSIFERIIDKQFSGCVGVGMCFQVAARKVLPYLADQLNPNKFHTHTHTHSHTEREREREREKRWRGEEKRREEKRRKEKRKEKREKRRE